MQHGDRNQLLSIWNPFVIFFSVTAIPSLIFLLVHCTCTSLASTLASSHWMLWLDCLTWTASTLLLSPFFTASLRSLIHCVSVLPVSPTCLYMYVFFATFTCIRRTKTSISDQSYGKAHTRKLSHEGQAPPAPPGITRVLCTQYRVNMEYIGETGRILSQWMSEHKRAVKNSDSNNAPRVHVKQSSHNIQWGEANVLAREGHWTKRKIKEEI